MVDEEENGESDSTEAVDRLAVRFEKPLEAAGVVVTELSTVYFFVYSWLSRSIVEIISCTWCFTVVQYSNTL